MERSSILLSILLLSGIANAECPKTEKEFMDKSAPFLVDLASRETKGVTTNFSSQLGKGAVSGTTTMKNGTEVWYFVRANYKTESISGVLKCDSVKNRIVAMSLGWDNGPKGSGVKGGPLE